MVFEHDSGTNRHYGTNRPSDNLDNLDELFQEEPRVNKFYLKRSIILAVSCISILAIGIYLYKNLPQDKTSELPIIYADDRPSKIEPSDPGGMIIANMDKAIYDNFTDSRRNLGETEQVLPKPEEPIALRPKEILVAPKETTPKTLPPQPKTQALPKEQKPEALSKEPKSQVLAKEPKPQVLAKELKAEIVPSSPEQDLNKKLAEIFAGESKAPLPQTQYLTLPQKTGIKVQLATYYSMREAQQAWIKLSKRYVKQLASLQSVISIKQVASKGKLYVLQAGYISDINKAHNLCKSLIAAGQACVLVK